MKCGWSILDKIETDFEKVNLKILERAFFEFESVESETSAK